MSITEDPAAAEEETLPEETLPEEIEETTPAPEEQEGPETYEDWLERVNANEVLKASHEARLDELRQEALKEGRKAAQSRLQPMVQQRRDNARAAAQALVNIEQAFKRAADEGTLDQNAVNQAWQQHHMYMNQLVFTANSIGEVLGVKDFIAHALGGERKQDGSGNATWSLPKDAAWGEKYLTQMDGVLEGQATPQEVAQDFFDDLIEARIAKAKAPLQAEIKALRAKYIEGGKASARSSQGVRVAGGQGRSDDELLLDPETPITTIEEILARRAG